MNYKIGKLKEPQRLILNNDNNLPQIIILNGELDVNLYDDITSIENWDKYGLDYFNDIRLVRNEIKKIVNSNSWDNLSDIEKRLSSKYFVIERNRRDEIIESTTQIEEAENLFKLSKRNESLIGGLLYNKTIDEIDDYLENSVGELFNYKELNTLINASLNGVWHEIDVPAEPNTVIMINITNTSGRRIGGVRQVGSNLNRKIKIISNGSFSLPVKVNSESKIEVYRQNDKIKFYITAQLS